MRFLEISAYIISRQQDIKKKFVRGWLWEQNPMKFNFDRLFKDMIVRFDFLYIRNYNNIEFIKNRYR